MGDNSQKQVKDGMLDWESSESRTKIGWDEILRISASGIIFYDCALWPVCRCSKSILCSGLIGWVFQEYKKANELRSLGRKKKYGLIWKEVWLGGSWQIWRKLRKWRWGQGLVLCRYAANLHFLLSGSPLPIPVSSPLSLASAGVL